MRLIYPHLVDALLLEASELADEVRLLISQENAPDAIGDVDVVGKLLESRDAMNMMSFVTHSVAWLLAANEVGAGRKPLAFLGQYSTDAVRADVVASTDSGQRCENIKWASVLRRSSELFNCITCLNNIVLTK